MPWVDQALCNGCGRCIDACQVAAISLSITESRAVLDTEKCTRCGRCRDVCPEQAIRNDSERIPDRVEDNVRWVRRLMDSCATPVERAAVPVRLARHFRDEMKVIQQTLERLSPMK